MARFLHPEQLHVIGRRFLNYSSGQTTAMRSCVRTSVSSKLGSQQLRWASHKPETLTKKALLEQVQAGLGKDVDGKPLRLNPKSKTVSTAAGHLPISPVFDPAWMQTRRRQTKADPQRPEGRFRRKLIMNPYARALATPIRRCAITETYLPRYFLQDLEAVKHPETGKTWLAPGPLAYGNVVPHYRPTETEAGEDGAMSATAAKVTRAIAGSATSEQRGDEVPRRAPVVVYALGSKAFLDALTPKHKRLAKLLYTRTGTTASVTLRGATYRSGMGDLILKQMRRVVADVLITRANRTRPEGESVPETVEEGSLDTGSTSPDPNCFIEPVQSWNDVQGVRRRASVLWMPSSDASADASSTFDTNTTTAEYATLDVPEAKYDRKMSVYDLRWLLGDEEVARTRSAMSELDRRYGTDNGGANGTGRQLPLGQKKADGGNGDSDGDGNGADAGSVAITTGRLYVLRYWPSRSMSSLHQLLWRLHGYLANNHIESERRRLSDEAINSD